MLRVADQQISLWDVVLPPEMMRLPDELARIDAYLDDERFVISWRGMFDTRLGRPSVPVDTLLRLLYLKHRYQFGYETLCREVADSITWRRFCRIPLEARVPHPTTLVKLVGRAGPEVFDQLNRELVGKLAADRLLRAGKLRIDSTVVEADIDHPTDADLLDHGIRKLGRLVRRIKATGAASRTAFRDRSRAAGRRIKQISRTLRRRTGQALGEIDRLTSEIADIATHTVTEVDAVTRNARRMLARRPSRRLYRLVTDLENTIAGTRRLLDQTAQRLAGNRIIPDRMVSLADPDARPIRKGKPQHPTQFGYTTLLVEDDRGFIPFHQVNKGNPSDARQLIPAVENVITASGRTPATVVADRGFGTAANDKALAELGVRHIGLQRNGTLSKTRREHERTRSFRRMRNWRIGVEARISHLKRGFGLRRTRMRRHEGARTWIGLGIFAYNLQRMTVISR
ncbi:ISNCY family transposase [Nocardia sp. CA-107356]|uniref:ISNCY family transposase n=1 Tax=Nocardia sp. CA-107356 TaxID=3239972 RepID=UPI003D92400C